MSSRASTLALVHAVAFLHSDGRNPFAVVEGEVHLAQIDVAVKRQLGRITPAVGVPPEPDSTCDSQDDGDDQETSHGMGLRQPE